MCDYSLELVRSRPAKVGDKLVTRNFGTGTRGFAAADDPELAVCVMPGTENGVASWTLHTRRRSKRASSAAPMAAFGELGSYSRISEAGLVRVPIPPLLSLASHAQAQ